MSHERSFADILVSGAGPAGMASAVRARESGAKVVVLDDNPRPGGQIWRNEQLHPSSHQASVWFRKFSASGVEVIAGARIVDGDAKRRSLIVEMEDRALKIEYRKLILATGARERFLPFPGWTLPNAMGVGGLQALVKSGLPVAQKRIIVAGTGPLLLAAAAYFRRQGAIVPIIAEQASSIRLARFMLRLLRHPAKLFQAAALRFCLRGTRYLTSCRVEAANGNTRLESVRLRRGDQLWQEDCDYLAIAYGFRPNVELAVLLGCQADAFGVRVDRFQQSSQEDIYCAGECTGVGGVELSILKGEIAGYAATGQTDLAARLFGALRKARHFAAVLESTFILGTALKNLALPDTIVCRCEDVTWQRLQSMESWRSAKLYTRCGMGPCQGRVCGPILEFLLGFHPEGVRPPAFPAALETLVE
ncbi:MAG TPA: FAD/NAD(P)-binding oxidoreductase [Bryobacteraceae bacterium]|jgi:NADPH-dependent 2,4-dienoyl-CoA reductase/sulfur reductase-like enzyme